MSLFIYFFELFKCIMRVNLCGRQICMTKQLLYRIKISSPVKHMCCKSMPQNMRTLLFNRSNHSKITIYYIINIFIIQLVPLVSNKKPTIISESEYFHSCTLIYSSSRLINGLTSGMILCLFLFPVTFNRTFRQINIIILQPYQLRPPHSCKIKHLNYCSVSYSGKIHLQNCNYQEVVSVPLLQQKPEALFSFRKNNLFKRIVLNNPLFSQITVKIPSDRIFFCEHLLWNNYCQAY